MLDIQILRKHKVNQLDFGYLDSFYYCIATCQKIGSYQEISKLNKYPERRLVLRLRSPLRGLLRSGRQDKLEKLLRAEVEGC